MRKEDNEEGLEMRQQTTLFKDMILADDKARYDDACKRLLAEKMILAWIMRACLEEYRPYDVKEIAEKYIEGIPQVSETGILLEDATSGSKITATGVEDITITEGKIIFDIRFNAIAPKSGKIEHYIINVEAQNNFYPGYPLVKRAIYYGSRMISAQYGTIFVKSHYERIQKVYSIWICMNPPKERRNTITGYSITEDNYVGHVTEKKEYYDLLTIIMICLGISEEDSHNKILRLLYLLFLSDREPDKKCEILEKEFDIPMTEAIEREVTTMCNLSQGVENRGIAKGIQQGIQVLISVFKELGKTYEETTEKVQEKFSLTEEQAAESMEKYW
ncbi:MAG: Rpn family recombination-promoting nuclease/putative transposase [Roseburia sp.]|nr:Rpn family recombination-promoting nuclease/putative transposase [Roseburia sp.]